MKTKTIISALLLSILFGCVPSLHQLYTDKDLTFEPRLLGAWTTGEDRWIFEKRSDEKSYDLTYIDKDGKKGKFQAHLVKLDKFLFLDIYPTEETLNECALEQFKFLYS